MAMTTLDLLLNPEILKEAGKYFDEEQGRSTTYEPFISEGDEPAIHLNRQIMGRVPAAAREALLRPEPLRHLPGTTGH